METLGKETAGKKALARDTRWVRGLPPSPGSDTSSVQRVFVSMFRKHHRINTFLHFREMISSAVLNDGSSFEKCKEKKLWEILKGDDVFLTLLSSL